MNLQNKKDNIKEKDLLNTAISDSYFIKNNSPNITTDVKKNENYLNDISREVPKNQLSMEEKVDCGFNNYLSKDLDARRVLDFNSTKYNPQTLRNQSNFNKNIGNFNDAENLNIKHTENSKYFFNISFSEKLKNDKISSSKKWSKEEDNLLIKLCSKSSNDIKINWNDIGKKFPFKSKRQIAIRHKIIMKNQKRGAWNLDEDRKIIELVKKHGCNWILLSKFFPNRSEKQIRSRYLNYLDKDLDLDRFSFEEDLEIMKYVSFQGKKWSDISINFKRRTSDHIKNRFYSCGLKNILDEIESFLSNQQQNDEEKQYSITVENELKKLLYEMTIKELISNKSLYEFNNDSQVYKVKKYPQSLIKNKNFIKTYFSFLSNSKLEKETKQKENDLLKTAPSNKNKQQITSNSISLENINLKNKTFLVYKTPHTENKTETTINEIFEKNDLKHIIHKNKEIIIKKENNSKNSRSVFEIGKLTKNLDDYLGRKLKNTMSSTNPDIKAVINNKKLENLPKLKNDHKNVTIEEKTLKITLNDNKQNHLQKEILKNESLNHQKPLTSTKSNLNNLNFKLMILNNFKNEKEKLNNHSNCLNSIKNLKKKNEIKTILSEFINIIIKMLSIEEKGKKNMMQNFVQFFKNIKKLDKQNEDIFSLQDKENLIFLTNELIKLNSKDSKDRGYFSTKNSYVNSQKSDYNYFNLVSSVFANPNFFTWNSTTFYYLLPFLLRINK